jgi:hypothetical protein
MKKNISLERWMIVELGQPESWQSELPSLEKMIEQSPSIHRRSASHRLFIDSKKEIYYLGCEISGTLISLPAPYQIIDFGPFEMEMTLPKKMQLSLNFDFFEKNALQFLKENTKYCLWGIDFRRRLEEDDQLRLEYVLIFFPKNFLENL